MQNTSNYILLYICEIIAQSSSSNELRILINMQQNNNRYLVVKVYGLVGAE